MMRMRADRRRGAVMLEYVLVGAVLILFAAMVTPYTIPLFGYAYEVLVSVVCSPFPAGL